MDPLNSLGLRVDAENNLRIISEETEKNSVELASKIKQFLTSEYLSFWPRSMSKRDQY